MSQLLEYIRQAQMRDLVGGPKEAGAPGPMEEESAGEDEPCTDGDTEVGGVRDAGDPIDKEEKVVDASGADVVDTVKTRGDKPPRRGAEPDAGEHTGKGEKATGASGAKVVDTAVAKRDGPPRRGAEPSGGYTTPVRPARKLMKKAAKARAKAWSV